LGLIATLEDRQTDVGVRRGDGLQTELGQEPLGHRPGVSGSGGQFHPLKLVFGVEIVSQRAREVLRLESRGEWDAIA
jgi:hypothetical protein